MKTSLLMFDKIWSFTILYYSQVSKFLCFVSARRVKKTEILLISLGQWEIYKEGNLKKTHTGHIAVVGEVVLSELQVNGWDIVGQVESLAVAGEE